MSSLAPTGFFRWGKSTKATYDVIILNSSMWATSSVYANVNFKCDAKALTVGR